MSQEKPENGWCSEFEKLVEERVMERLEQGLDIFDDLPSPAIKKHIASCDVCIAHRRRLDEKIRAIAKTREALIATGIDPATAEEMVLRVQITARANKGN